MSKIKLPITRYYGSKRKLVDLIWNELEKRDLKFDSVLDIFGGSGIFSYYAKMKGKKVYYNDIFLFNQIIGRALIENDKNHLSNEDIDFILKKDESYFYDDIIEKNFEGIYYTNEENAQLDIIVQNITRLSKNKQDSAYYILFQSCLIKRPYNLFHRKNLNLRTNFTGGGFGNKITWERSFKELFYKFNEELDQFVFSNGFKNKSYNYSALKCVKKADLVYIDPPYFKKDNHVPYHSKYHFLEGIANYQKITQNIDLSKKHKEIILNKSTEFETKSLFLRDLEVLFEKHKKSILAVSYRSNGVPTILEIEDVMNKYKNNVFAISLKKYSYALNKKDSENYEYLILGF